MMCILKATQIYELLFRVNKYHVQPADHTLSIFAKEQKYSYVGNIDITGVRSCVNINVTLIRIE